MIIDCAHYQDGRRRDEGAVPLEEAAARCGQGGFVWLGLLEPSEEELAQVRATFGLHELAVEDAQNFHMRPKIELYDQDVRLVILRTARYDDAAEEVEFGEISVFLAPTFVITVRQGVASELHGARQRLEQRPELLAAGSTSALWAILDQVVDDYAPVVAGLERDIDQIEATVFSGAVAPTERIYSLRREATDFYRAVHPLLAVVATVERGTEAPQLQPYLRDVQDHLLLVNEEVAAQRDLLGTVLEANMAVISVEQTKVSVRQNTTIEQLTVPAADLHHWLLRPELRVADRAHQQLDRVHRLWPRRSRRAAGAAVPVAETPHTSHTCRRRPSRQLTQPWARPAASAPPPAHMPAPTSSPMRTTWLSSGSRRPAGQAAQ
jgi:magnesium transporter